MLILSSLNDSRLPELLKNGAVGIVPTDTIYGIVADASNPQAAARLYSLKHREHKPGTVIAATADQLITLGVAEDLIRSVMHLWPNPLSVELPIGDNLAHLHQDTGHGAFRVVADDTVRALLENTGPLLTSSANHPGMTPAMNIATARAYFGGGVDFYVDGGELGNRPPSTVVRLKDGRLVVVRQGAVTIDQ
ncbi:MAG TPA: L-threonylcarbamoyladenylate synthase [Candidatus Saccharimonadales bacterium]|jgi:L-threonylcarbamoyladenylate synthase|nr:L-threonylcarbamoyladenylate synthase [Candidatus Saccharimonadales bacterium]